MKNQNDITSLDGTYKNRDTFHGIFILVMFLCSVILVFVLGSNRVETNPKVMQFAHCDDSPLELSEYVKYNAYIDKHIMAQTAYFGYWNLESRKCKRITILNSDGEVLWDNTQNDHMSIRSGDEFRGSKLVMRRTTYPHTIIAQIQQ